MDTQQTDLLLLRNAELEKELKTEAALERVRTRALAMQRSDELKDVVKVVFQTLQELGVEVSSVSINVFIEGSNDTVAYICGQNEGELALSHFRLFYFDHPILTDRLQARKNGMDFFSKTYNAEEKNNFYKHLFDVSELKYAPEEIKRMVLNGSAYTMSLAMQKASMIVVNDFTGKPLPASQINVLKRFSQVFEQAYTRFLDLQKAEAQAREATKRASVDRVRAEIASMRTTKDLERITPLVWNELTTLDVPFIRCGVFIMDEERRQIETHLSTPDGKALATFNLPYNAAGETAQILAHWRKKELYKQHWNESQYVEFTKDLVQQGAITSGEKALTENQPTDLYLHFLPFVQGMLYVGTDAPLSNDGLHLAQSLADAFSTAYARYEDFNKLEAAKQQVDRTLMELKQTQQQLIQAEKMASLGELTAGIAHEIQNPLNFVNNFSEINKELVAELKQEIEKGNFEAVKTLSADIEENEQKISHHGQRADAIVKGMLQHSSVSTGQKEPTDINALVAEYLRLSYHGFRAKDKSFEAAVTTQFDDSIGKIAVVPQDIGRVLLNLFNNAFYYVNEKRRKGNGDFEPAVSVTTKKDDGKIEIRINDNGTGIPEKIVDKIFQPFFTTKPTGEGTGLGLSLSYDIVTKQHGGTMEVKTKEGQGAELLIELPAFDK